MTQMTRSRSRAARLALLIAVPALALTTACGGAAESSDGGVASVSNAPSTDQTKDGADASKDGAPKGKSAFYDAQMKFVQCMRKKINKDYPDPKLSGHLDWTKIDALQEAMGNDRIAKGGRDGECTTEMRKAMSLEPPRDTQKDYESMLAHAKCMRANGVSKFTNPQLQDGNVIPGGDPNPTSPEVSSDSSTYKQARQACKDKLLDGLDGMQ
ncbi:hypothetical protein YWIDRAFT_01516 [Streptomyces sp. SceaMP-e96]|uniref:hypothetical protein n=1 Tax=Streptomyces TaxID=1883 RepID=UPI000823D396|nr:MULTISPECIES: hypothetical protein [unclassified Streptomyces]MYT12272.1 hypothetical protein [Streptomyces sp. SID4951]SCK28691.1 hypothetical protein YWIDRAFT_01516 [Streptomyces sp. SceaMP-e96]